MKKSIFVVTFVVAYLIFAISTMPAAQVLSWVSLPKNIKLVGVSGTVWQGKLQQVVYQNNVINNVRWQLSPWSLLVADPTIDTTFGGSSVDGPEGKAIVSGLLSQQIQLEQTEVFIEANQVIAQLPMPVPMTAAGLVRLTLPSFKMGQPICQVATGKLNWRSAQVTAFQEAIDLDDLNANLACENGALTVTIDPNNILGLEFKATVSSIGKISGSGLLTPGASFPQKLKPALPFIGRADSRGRYPLKI